MNVNTDWITIDISSPDFERALARLRGEEPKRETTAGAGGTGRLRAPSPPSASSAGQPKRSPLVRWLWKT